ncbi:hypothetical protein ACFLVS_06885 [Chloroflexota bacterium]
MTRLITITLAILLLLCMVTALLPYTPVVAAAQSPKVYWTDAGTDKIQRANLDGTSVEDLVTGLGNPHGIALDVAGSKMYWTDAGTNKIQRANLDGTVVEELVTTGLDYTYGIALDLRQAVGGEAYPVNKIAVLWPWFTLATAIIIGGIILLRRRAHI